MHSRKTLTHELVVIGELVRFFVVMVTVVLLADAIPILAKIHVEIHI